jgi:hypothetical protein
MGFGPTFRKSYHNPHSEQLMFFILIAVRNFIAIVALANYSITTVIFPALTGLACLLFIGMVMYRRKILPQHIV